MAIAIFFYQNIVQVTFLLKAYIILFKEFNSLEIDKKMPKLNYYKRLG